MFAFLPRDLAFVARMVLMLLWLAAFAVLLSACNVVRSAAGSELAQAVNRYCALPVTERVLLRLELNELIAPHAFELQCASEDDPPDA